MNLKEMILSGKHITENQKRYDSPSGKYYLLVTPVSIKEGCWTYSFAELYTSNGKLQNIMYRNYPHFPHIWIENHTDGNDYLIYGESYMGMSIFNITTGESESYIPDKEDWCFSHFNGLSPNSKILAIGGCWWASPGEIRLLDFSNPMNVPYKVLKTIDEYYFDQMYERILGFKNSYWKDNNTFIVEYIELIDPESMKSEEEIYTEIQDKYIKYHNKDVLKDFDEIYQYVEDQMKNMVFTERVIKIEIPIG